MQEEDVAVDYHSKIGQVRVLIPDLEEVDWDDSGTSSYLFEDPQLEALLDLNDGRVRLAAADAVEAVAFSEALISKVIKTEDLETDGAKVASAMLAKARQLRDADEREDRRKASDHFHLARFRPVPANVFRRGL